MMVYSSGKEVKQLVAYAREEKLRDQLTMDRETKRPRRPLKVKRDRAKIMAAVLDELCVDGLEVESI
jgi:hypothetical protein